MLIYLHNFLCIRIDRKDPDRTEEATSEKPLNSNDAITKVENLSINNHTSGGDENRDNNVYVGRNGDDKGYIKENEMYKTYVDENRGNRDSKDDEMYKTYVDAGRISRDHNGEKTDNTREKLVYKDDLIHYEQSGHKRERDDDGEEINNNMVEDAEQFIDNHSKKFRGMSAGYIGNTGAGFEIKYEPHVETSSMQHSGEFQNYCTDMCYWWTEFLKLMLVFFFFFFKAYQKSVHTRISKIDKMNVNLCADFDQLLFFYGVNNK